MGFYDWLNDRLKLLAYQICDPTKPKTPSDVTTQIAKQAYGLYEQQGHREGHAKQNWLQAEQEIREDEAHK